MDITLIAIAILILVAVVFLSLFLFKNINKKSFMAEDGSVFDNQSDLDLYQNLYEQTKPLFITNVQQGPNQQILGFDSLFLSKITTDGFPDLKTLIKYRKQLKSLSDLINN
tara:strand:+ start:1486 stop:1818 length:333 start_codon:yes stop_codon:yes gene_type:complete